MLHTAKEQQPDPTAAAAAADGTTTTTTKQKLIFAPGDSGALASQASQFHKGALDLGDLSPSPLTQFHTWFGQASASAAVAHPETATFATAELPSGRVSARVVYMKELDDRGFVVYSNWGTSRKAKDVASNPHAALTFWWEGLERQVRVEGRVERLSEEESQVYYDTRIRGSRVGAWASRQSEVLEGGREELEERVREVERRFEGQEKIPVPPFWGGVRIVPSEVEFWQGRESRLHDRFRYTKEEGKEAGWKVQRLSP
ncbi:Pyridoxamine 5'-phosphate oxidase [Lasiodiplodia hormozganensis]|uniref:pyridoxal 5'-phosphate synthase n=1 Tax=Lasiodiplodia hormozganensis TaxID=869390 RepID=A0AA39YJQ4_9PEZI|nr:Pyridoxamine 5'-phosphate oxidase [Lasiodiplodia hormozganensis]